MSHKPIFIRNLSIQFFNKTCFEAFETTIHAGDKIGIIGNNGSGKTSLLRVLNSEIEPFDGKVENLKLANVEYVPQVISNYTEHSGGERFNKYLSQVLYKDLDILLLDEPTNHLDLNNRKSLFRKLKDFQNTLIIASHDEVLLREIVDIIWHIDNGKVRVFAGGYDDLLRELKIGREAIECEITNLQASKKEAHNSLMKEQERDANAKQRGKKAIQNRKWPTVRSLTKIGRSVETSVKKVQEINRGKAEISERLSQMHQPEILKPKFNFNYAELGMQTVVSISEGEIGYSKPLLKNISLTLTNGQRMAIVGNNGSGKSTLVKAILNDSSINKSGSWYAPCPKDIGYLDQFYSNLDLGKTVIESIYNDSWDHAQKRKHLNDFLFRKNEEVNALVANLSGGEKCRLSLAQIAAKDIKLLILDEITNNIDLQTKNHIIQVLQNYHGALIVISHDEAFLEASGIKDFFVVEA